MPATEEKVSPRVVWWLLATVLVVELMDLLDSTIVNVAGPSLEQSLGTSPVGLQWVIGGCALALGAGLVLGAVADDEVGSASGVLTAVQSIGGSVGVAVFSTVFFADATRPVESFRDALVVQAIGIGLFLLMSPLFPRRARPDETTTETPTTSTKGTACPATS